MHGFLIARRTETIFTTKTLHENWPHLDVIIQRTIKTSACSGNPNWVDLLADMIDLLADMIDLLADMIDFLADMIDLLADKIDPRISWNMANARNVRLYYPYWHYTNLSIFRYWSQHTTFTSYIMVTWLPKSGRDENAWMTSSVQQTTDILYLSRKSKSMAKTFY